MEMKISLPFFQTFQNVLTVSLLDISRFKLLRKKKFLSIFLTKWTNCNIFCSLSYSESHSSTPTKFSLSLIRMTTARYLTMLELSIFIPFSSATQNKFVWSYHCSLPLIVVIVTQPKDKVPRDTEWKRAFPNDLILHICSWLFWTWEKICSNFSSSFFVYSTTVTNEFA